MPHQERKRYIMILVTLKTKAGSVQHAMQEKAMTAYIKTHLVLKRGIKDCRGQGTTEYAILVGVLVVIAILAITIFRPKIQELWDAIATGINGL